MATSIRPSSGTEGFFQPEPKLENQLYEDAVLNRIFQFYLPSQVRKTVSPDLSSFGSLVLEPHVFDLVADAERHLPSVSTHSTFGVPRTLLHTGRGWRELQSIGIQQGIVAIPFEAYYGHHSRVYQFIKYHLWTGSCANVTCPSAMSDGAARLLSKHLASCNLSKEQQRAFRSAYKNLISRDPQRAWTSGQWMTERSGGSDVRGTETIATAAPTSQTDSIVGATDAEGLPLGPYSVSGFKWFSSATDANMAILLAKSPSGISAFFAPMRRSISSNKSKTLDIAAPSARDCEMNGISIQRLKPKLGTKSLATGELVLKDTRAWMIGKEGQGVKEIATILNITRIHTALTALGYWGRGLAISRAFARVRKVDGGRPLDEMPAHVKTLASNTVNYAAMMHLGYFTVTLLGICEHPNAFESQTSNPGKTLVANVEQAALLLRLITPATKAECSKMSIHGLQECMESLGGVGYLEDEQEFNIARLFRDANVLSIWEGTTEVMATDVVRVLKGRDGDKIRRALSEWAQSLTKQWEGEWGYAEELVRAEVGKLEEMSTTLGVEELRFSGRSLLKSLAWIVPAVLLIQDANSNPAASETARRWIARKEPEGSLRVQLWQDVAVLDRKIAFAKVKTTEFAKI